MTTKVVSVSPDPSLHLGENHIKCEVKEDSTVHELIEKAKTCFGVPFPEKSVYRLYPKNIDTPLDSDEHFTNIPHVNI